MKQIPASPWHKKSYENFLNQLMPELLSQRLPLVSYHVDTAGKHTCDVRIGISNNNGDIEATFTLPLPDDDGIFRMDGESLVVIPFALSDDLETAKVQCVGERLLQYIDNQLGAAPENLPWDSTLLNAWLPLDQWLRGFFGQYAQKLDQTNWLATQRHLRAISLPKRGKVISPSHAGRVCPFETPEGPNIGRIMRIAVGAAILNGAIQIVDDSPTGALGLTANMLPLLEHDDPNRLLMAANMMGQWILPPDPEPALVQTGFEPNTPDFWCGRNLLTAFISWGGDTIEDGIVISESGAARFGYPHPTEPGDKFSNRHGTKGVISRILPDHQMPHLLDGTPVELVYSFVGVPGRLNFGQILECLWGRIARVEGKPVVIPPFNSPDEDQLRQRMAMADLPPDGMETLTLGAEGQPLETASTVGWVYWGKTVHLAESKLMGGGSAPLATAREQGLQRQAELEFRALRDATAYETILETFNTRAAKDERGDLVINWAAGTVQQKPPPTPRFAALQKKLAIAGILLDLQGESLSVGFLDSGGDRLRLARPVRHPWIWEREITDIGVCEAAPSYALVFEANARLARMLESSAPASLIENAYTQLQSRVDDFFTVLLAPVDLKFDARVQFSGRSLLAPGPEFRLDQVGLADELAWRLFSSSLERVLADETAVRNRTPEAARVLDQLMADTWIIINRAPSLTPTAILAFHPVRIQDRVIRINPLLCPWLNADFDGDQVAVFLPLTTGGQEEAGERLSVAGHLGRDPELIRSLVPAKSAIWGLVKTSLSPHGRHEIQATIQAPMPDGYLTQIDLEDAIRVKLEENGIEAAIQALEHLARSGFEAAKHSGASVPPFIGESLKLPPIPADTDPVIWQTYADQVTELIASRRDFDDPDLGTHLLLIRSRKRIPPPRVYTLLCVTRGVVNGLGGEKVIIRNSSKSGLTLDEIQACVVGSREGLARIVEQWEQPEQFAQTSSGTQNYNVLARARKATNPGIVFARAAAIGEIDPLVDIDSRLFVGLRP